MTNTQVPSRDAKRRTTKGHNGTTPKGINGITNPSIRRMALKAGVQRLSRPVYKTTRDVLEVYLLEILKKTLLYAGSSNRKTVGCIHVVRATQLQGNTLLI